MVSTHLEKPICTHPVSQKLPPHIAFETVPGFSLDFCSSLISTLRHKPINWKKTPSPLTHQQSCGRQILFIPEHQNILVGALSASSLQLSGICCLPVCKISPFCLEFKIHLKTSLFLTGFFTKLGRPFL